MPAFTPDNGWGLPSAQAQEISYALTALAPMIDIEREFGNDWNDVPGVPDPSLRTELLAPEPFTDDLTGTPKVKRHITMWVSMSVVLETTLAPGETFTVREIAERFGVPTYSVANTLRTYRARGIVAIVEPKSSHINHYQWLGVPPAHSN